MDGRIWNWDRVSWRTPLQTGEYIKMKITDEEIALGEITRSNS